MKKSYLLSVLAILMLTACSKNKSDQTNEKVLTGVWELRERVGGMMPYNVEETKPGNGNLWTFNQNEFAHFYQKKLQYSGTYSISHGTGKDMNTDRDTDQFIFDSYPPVSFELVNGTLKMYHHAVALDGVILSYVKISDDASSVD